MRTAEDNYSSKQLDRLVNEIEGRLNDFEGGISEKDETIKSFAFFIGECVKNAVNNALTEHDKEIISLIDEMIGKTDVLHVNGIGKIVGLQELKEKLK